MLFLHSVLMLLSLRLAAGALGAALGIGPFLGSGSSGEKTTPGDGALLEATPTALIAK